ncbi:glycerol-3-phosphate responsive antiterminator [Oceanobacillus damuensis]|uniref:glycerol-3-phosphate responsive antiterminator n=1 Tax=Oceanobacillus damuensis TaxID=937928 RepID=UPI0008320BEE|nr:glycerol-3-phosphate responsive antiterminator [Oceanobacillus damuensis]
MSLLHLIGKKPIIAALRDIDDFQKAIDSNVDNIFYMGGDVQQVIEGVRLAKEHNKRSFIHIDLIKGISNTDKETISFIKHYIQADGIVTPKKHLIREANKHELYAIFHLFILDSLSMMNGTSVVESVQPDAIDLMPGVIPKIINKFATDFIDIPIISSGLIQTVEEAKISLDAGATALAVSNGDLWNLTFDELI